MGGFRLNRAVLVLPHIPLATLCDGCPSHRWHCKRARGRTGLRQCRQCDAVHTCAPGWEFYLIWPNGT